MTTDMLLLSQSQSCRFLIHDVFTGLFMTYHRVCSKCKTTGATCGTGTAYSSGSHRLHPRCLLVFVLL